MKKSIITIIVLAMATASSAITPLLPPAWTHRLAPAWSPATRKVYRASTPISTSSASTTTTSASAVSSNSFKWVLHITYIKGDSVVSEAEGDTIYASRSAAYSKMTTQVNVLLNDGWTFQWQSEFISKDSSADQSNYTIQYEKDGVVCVMSINKYFSSSR